MSNFCVMLVFKTVIYKSKLLGFKDFASLELEHSESNTNFNDRHKIGQNDLIEKGGPGFTL